MCACGGRPPEQTGATARPADVALPAIPDSLREPQSRARWLGEHYWMLHDFSDMRLSLDTAYMEQSFANFTTVLQLLDGESRARSVRAVMDRAAEYPAAYDFLADIAGRYLYDPASPLYSEELYLPFVEYMLARGENPALEVIREMILKNRPGTSAPDFEYETPEGHRRRLIRHDDSRRILLMFYEPDCGRCNAVIDALAASTPPEDMRVLLIYMGSDTELWRTHASTLPPHWEAGRDAEGMIDSEDLYIIRATPTLYLLEADGTVVSKDVTQL